MKGYKTYALGMIGVLVLVAGAEAYVFFADFTEPVISKLNDLQKEALATYRELTSVLIGLATLVFAAANALRIKAVSANPSGKIRQLRFIATCFTAGASIYFGYLSLRMASWMLESSFFNLSVSMVRWPSRMQWACMLFSVFALLDFTFNTTSKPTNKIKKNGGKG